ncbi:MAG: aspartate--tRNA ligase [Gemmatimonadota bacterium]|nr:aspartate--tRNA ligase [Gemmatimonadota bacterium]
MTATTMRTHRCGALRAEHAGKTVRLGGWVHRRRNLGGLVFLDLRDRDGIVQVSFGPDSTAAETLERALEVVPESVVIVTGAVRLRPEDARNPEMVTGDVEVVGEALDIVGPATLEALPIPVWRTKGEDPPGEELRLLHRHLDLRRRELQQNLALRHRLLQRARSALSALEFYEIETPILTKPTPEGARDYLVPSRLHRGQFYALPQSPQLYKQLLMVAGFDRYFQLARCFRDEDLRADRQPEFTQIDIEASFVSSNDIYAVLEHLFVALWDEAGHEIAAPFRRVPYAEVLERFGTDKPDLRYGLPIEDWTDRLANRGFRAFDDQVGGGGRVRGLLVPGGATLSRKDLDALTTLAKEAGAGGLAVLKHRDGTLSGPLAKLDGMSADLMQLRDGDLLVATAGADATTSSALDVVRRATIQRMGLKPDAPHAFLWVDQFPLFEQDVGSGKWAVAHHPFTAPHPDDRDRLLAGEREGVRALHYDLVYNGNELGSGSIRITDPQVQLAVLDLLGMSEQESIRRFGFLLRALRAGAPPHGGFAVGFDRVVMLLAGASNLRDVIAFPKTTAARALFEDAPTELDPAELSELSLKIEHK